MGGPISLVLSLLAASAGPTPVGPLLHPAGPGPGEWRLGAGLEVDLLPRFLVEAELRALPRAALHLRLGLIDALTLDLSLTGIVLTNEARAGLSYSVGLGPLTLALHDRFGFGLGVVDLAGFDTMTWSISNTPGASVGIEIQGSWLSLRFEPRLALLQRVRFGSATIAPRLFTFAGTSTTFAVETPLDGGLLYYGLTLLWTVADDQLWLAFSDAKGRLIYPRFFAGYAF
ncbi:MAG: hypothetical protein IT384_23150 [Deltaproteobacteria bacterium]|nr:hypothetical protein [Deltaproteobacteria bacterium]